jgi:hypothetical protein
MILCLVFRGREVKWKIFLQTFWSAQPTHICSDAFQVFSGVASIKTEYRIFPVDRVLFMCELIQFSERVAKIVGYTTFVLLYSLGVKMP